MREDANLAENVQGDNRGGGRYALSEVLLRLHPDRRITYDYDVVIDRGQVRKRKKKPSRKCRDEFGHTPLSVEEKIPWKCQQLVIGTGQGALPVMPQIKREARRRKIKLLILPTAEAIEALKESADDTNAILHLTC